MIEAKVAEKLIHSRELKSLAQENRNLASLILMKAGGTQKATPNCHDRSQVEQRPIYSKLQNR